MVKCRSLKIIDYNNTALPHLSPVNHQISIFSAQVSRIKQSHMTWLIRLQLKTCKLQEDKHMSPLLGPECLEASLGTSAVSNPGLSLLLLPHSALDSVVGRGHLRALPAWWQSWVGWGFQAAGAVKIVGAVPGHSWLRTPSPGDPSVRHLAAGRWCPEHPDTQGDPAKVRLRLRPSQATGATVPLPSQNSAEYVSFGTLQ